MGMAIQIRGWAREPHSLPLPRNVWLIRSGLRDLAFDWPDESWSWLRKVECVAQSQGVIVSQPAAMCALMAWYLRRWMTATPVLWEPSWTVSTSTSSFDHQRPEPFSPSPRCRSSCGAHRRSDALRCVVRKLLTLDLG